MLRFEIGADETAFTRGTAAKPTMSATGVVGLHRGKLIDTIEGCRRRALVNSPSGQPAE